MPDLIVLRDLPGVAHISELCLNPRNFEYPQSSYTNVAIHDASVGLFCISAWDTTSYDDDIEGDDAETEEEGGEEDLDGEEVHPEDRYQVTVLPWPASKPFWEAIGWDISDGRGNELVSAHYFARQIIACVGGLVEGAEFHPNGDGTAAFDDDGQPINRDQAWVDTLETQAAEFLRRKGRL
jgi:hypothetical protein